MSPLRVTLVGLGRMGQAIMRSALQCADVQVLGAVTGPHSRLAGGNFGELVPGAESVPLLGSLAEVPQETEVVIDFSRHEATSAVVALCAGRGLALVCGTTGIPDQLRARLQQEDLGFACLYAGNMSLGVQLLLHLAELVAGALPEPYQCELTETHHLGKLDAPSGTALALAEAVTRGRGSSAETLRFGRPREARARDSQDIFIHSLRLGSNPGEHTLHFGFGQEELSLSHRALDRAIFADGALRAAHFLRGREAGPYSMKHVLGLA